MSSPSRWQQSGLPKWEDLMWEMLLALREAPTPITVNAASDAVSDRLGLTPEQRAVPSHDERKSFVRFQVGFVLSNLKGIGALDQPKRSLYDLTGEGRDLSRESLVRRHTARMQEIRERKQARKAAEGASVDQTDVDEAEVEQPGEHQLDWRQDLLNALKSLSPAAFEQLAAALLEAADFDEVEVTGRSGDGGIDGIGVYHPSGLISFHTAFQCKRYQGSVGAGAVRDFRGSFIGRSDRGIIITTGTFTSAAREEAARPGANPVDLIDGEALCELLKEYQLGVRVTQRTIEDIAIDDAYFERLDQ